MPVTPVTQTIHFDPHGGPLAVRLTAGYAAPGHYDVMLLEHDRITIAKDWDVVELSTPSANTHALPGDAGEQDGRILHAVTSVGIVDENGQFAVFMDVLQAGQKLGTVADSGTAPGSDTRVSDLVAVLSGTPATVAFNASLARLVRGGGGDALSATDLTERREKVREATLRRRGGRGTPGRGGRKGPGGAP